MIRLVACLVGLVLVVAFFFPDQVHHAAAMGREVIERLATGAAGSYGAMAR